MQVHMTFISKECYIHSQVSVWLNSHQNNIHQPGKDLEINTKKTKQASMAIVD